LYSPLTSKKIKLAPTAEKFSLLNSVCIIEEIVQDFPLPVFPRIAE